MLWLWNRELGWSLTIVTTDNMIQSLWLMENMHWGLLTSSERGCLRWSRSLPRLTQMLKFSARASISALKLWWLFISSSTPETSLKRQHCLVSLSMVGCLKINELDYSHNRRTTYKVGLPTRWPHSSTPLRIIHGLITATLRLLHQRQWLTSYNVLPAVGPFQLPAPQSGTLSQIWSRTRLSVQTASDVYLKCIFFHSIVVNSACSKFLTITVLHRSS